MRARWRWEVLTMALMMVALTLPRTACASEPPPVLQLTIADQIITPIIAEYVEQGVTQASATGAVVVITLDTPGGLLSATQTIVRTLMNATVPVIVYVAPDGARAASAGTFITLAAHVAAMAPSTRIGAAHPVDIAGGPTTREAQPEQTPRGATPMHDKIMEDTVAWIKGIASARKRNVEWAVDAVQKSRSSTADEAMKLKVIDLVADSLGELLRQVDGRKVTIGDTPWILYTAAATPVPVPMTARQKLLQVLSNPNIAYILMMLGFYGLLFEITHPGGWVPGIAGAICLIVAFYALHQLPTNYAGLAFIVLALLLFLAEVKVTSYGFLTVAGLACLTFGSMILIDSEAEFLKISLSVMIPVVAATAFVALLLGTLAIRSMRTRVSVGVESMIGRTAVADRALMPGGTISLDGEIWDAEAEASVAIGETVKIVAVDGMRLKVRKTH